MQYYLVATATLGHREHSAFTYSSKDVLTMGTIVLVSFGKKEISGVVVKQVGKPSDFEVKEIIRVLEDTPLPWPLVQLSDWLHKYYHSHPATVWQTILPRGLAKKRRALNTSFTHPKRNRTNIVLNDEQTAAINTIQTMSSGTALLQGITGSGKTQVYIESAKKVMNSGKSVILLVPEIALTSQLVAEFTHHFEDIIITHSTMTEAERHAAWRESLRSKKPRIVVGPRSALFAPLANIGLIIIDECHEPSFKQEQSPRYSALRAASVLASLHKAKLVLGSATPSIADRYLAGTSNRPVIHLTKVARAGARPPEVKIIDMTKKEFFTKHRFISNDLIAEISTALAAGKQSLLFHNRRGSTPTTLCEGCGWTAACQRCFVPLTLHGDAYELRCHICNHTEKVPTSCPECSTTNIIHKGVGTKLVADELKKLFPKARIARFDADSQAHETVEKLYQELYDGAIDIIIGTQVIAKGLDLPKLQTVGIIQADSGLALPDYQSTERVFQLIAQVRGRIGRGDSTSTIIIQSYQPTHPSITLGVAQDYTQFYAACIEERQRALFPPFTHLLKLTCVYKTEAGAIRACQNLAKQIRSAKHKDVTILGPTPAFYERVRDTYRWQIILKSPKREHLIELLKLVPPAKWQSELDPMSLL